MSHNALIYRGVDEFVDRVSGFVRDGLAAGDRVMVMAPPGKLAPLGEALADHAHEFELHDSTAAYRPQARSLQVAMDYVGEQPTRRTRLVAEQDLSARTDLEIAAYLRQEASSNLVFAGFPAKLLCTYDAAALPGYVVDGCRHTHQGLLENNGLVASTDYVEPADYLRASIAIPEPPQTAASLTCDSIDDLAAARQLVAQESARLGLDRGGVEDLVLAANEVLTNAVTHGRPPARLVVYREGPAVVCHVGDHGRGLHDPLRGYFPPGIEHLTGRGLWLARQLCDSVEIDATRDGTRIRLLSLPSS